MNWNCNFERSFTIWYHFIETFTLPELLLQLTELLSVLLPILLSFFDLLLPIFARVIHLDVLCKLIARLSIAVVATLLLV